MPLGHRANKEENLYPLPVVRRHGRDTRRDGRRGQAMGRRGKECSAKVTVPYKNRIDRELHREGLINAGLPE